MKRLDEATLALLAIAGNNRSNFKVSNLTDDQLDGFVNQALRVMAAVDRAQPAEDDEEEGPVEP